MEAKLCRYLPPKEILMTLQIVHSRESVSNLIKLLADGNCYRRLHIQYDNFSVKTKLQKAICNTIYTKRKQMTVEMFT
jgi:hypothetical protein